MTPILFEDPMEKRKRLAWDVASSICVQTKEDPVLIYNRILEKYERFDKEGQIALCESIETR